jgi:hypothetical protein
VKRGLTIRYKTGNRESVSFKQDAVVIMVNRWGYPQIVAWGPKVDPHLDDDDVQRLLDELVHALELVPPIVEP